MLSIEQGNNLLLESIRTDINAIQGEPSSELASEIFLRFLQVQEEQVGKEPTPAFENTRQLIEERICPYISVQEVSKIEKDFVSFKDCSGHFFGSAFPCTIVYGKESYSSAAEFFTCREFFDTLESPDMLLECQMAKFEQNEALKAHLLATGDAYILCQDSPDNALGRCLMSVREKLGGNGIVKFSHDIANRCLKFRCQLMTQTLDPNLCHIILNNCDLPTLASCSSVNTHWYQALQSLPVRMDLGQLYKGRVTLFDLQSYSQEVIGNSKERHLTYQDLKEIHDFLALSDSRVTSYPNREFPGVTCLTMPEGLTLNHLIKMGKDSGMEIDAPHVDARIGDVSIEKTYRTLLMDGLFDKEYNRTLEQQKESAAADHVDLMSLQELTALYVFTFISKKEYLYQQYYKGSGKPEEIWGRVLQNFRVGGLKGCSVAQNSPSIMPRSTKMSFGGARPLPENESAQKAQDVSKGDSL